MFERARENNAPTKPYSITERPSSFQNKRLWFTI